MVRVDTRGRSGRTRADASVPMGASVGLWPAWRYRDLPGDSRGFPQ